MTEKYYAKIVGRNLKRIAYDHRKTQADIAKDLNISKSTVSSWMNGTRVPKMDKIDLLCHYFNCKRADIMEERHDDYYSNPETAIIAQEYLENPSIRLLFDASRGATPEQLELAAKMLKQMKRTNGNG